MTNHCEHCTFWQGTTSSSRADCTHENTIGTTSFNDTCAHFKGKIRNELIDESGKISGWRLTSGGVISTGTRIYIGDTGKVTADDTAAFDGTFTMITPPVEWDHAPNPALIFPGEQHGGVIV